MPYQTRPPSVLETRDENSLAVAVLQQHEVCRGGTPAAGDLKVRVIGGTVCAHLESRLARGQAARLLLVNQRYKRRVQCRLLDLSNPRNLTTIQADPRPNGLWY